MTIEDDDFAEQKRIFKCLDSEFRLKLLAKLSEGPTSAPDLANEFDRTPETIVNNLNQLADAGFAISKEVMGPGGRPRKQFRLPDNGIRLELEVIEDEYHFDFGEPDIHPRGPI